MRRRVAALIALAGLAVIPAASGAAAGSAAMLRVSVKPSTGSGRTHFAISFRAPHATGRAAHSTFRITASGPPRSGCQSSAAAVAPPVRSGATEHVVLAPAGSKSWCGGTFRGQVWDVITEPCLPGKACPAILPVPRMVAKFTFRVTRG
jgi:hypothetical protein